MSGEIPFAWIEPPDGVNVSDAVARLAAGSEAAPRPHLVVIAVTVTPDDCSGPDQFGRLSCFRVAASSRHASPHAASRSLMWSSLDLGAPRMSSACRQWTSKNH